MYSGRCSPYTVQTRYKALHFSPSGLLNFGRALGLIRGIGASAPDKAEKMWADLDRALERLGPDKETELDVYHQAPSVVGQRRGTLRCWSYRTIVDGDSWNPYGFVWSKFVATPESKMFRDCVRENEAVYLDDDKYTDVEWESVWADYQKNEGVIPELSLQRKVVERKDPVGLPERNWEMVWYSRSSMGTVGGTHYWGPENVGDNFTVRFDKARYWSSHS